MDKLWDSRCTVTTANDVKHMISLGLTDNISKAAAEKTFYYQRGIKDPKNDKPILVLLHGYPQTSFLWRHIVSYLPRDIPLFIPDLPGYGRSSPLSGPHDKRSTGKAILKTLHSLLSHSNKQPIIVAGHDRGARICHRLAVDQADYPHFSIKGAMLLDIVPTSVQWKTFGMAAASVDSFHWPFLANVEVATEMMKAQGGDAFARTCLNRWVGKSDHGLAKFKENDSIAIYANSFKYESVIRATCDDYRASAQEDIQLQDEDQQAGRKVDVDVLLLYSDDHLGKGYDVKQVWQEWMGHGKLKGEGFGGGVGHFIAEEAPEGVAPLILSFYNERT